jgi:hypothetical protein
MDIETSEQLRWYIDTLKTLFEHAYRENNRPVCDFLRRYLDGHLPRAALVPLMADTKAGGVPSAAETRLAATATIMAAPVRPLGDFGPSDSGDGGIKAKLPDGPKPRSPSPVAAKW